MGEGHTNHRRPQLETKQKIASATLKTHLENFIKYGNLLYSDISMSKIIDSQEGLPPGADAFDNWRSRRDPNAAIAILTAYGDLATRHVLTYSESLNTCGGVINEEDLSQRGAESLLNHAKNFDPNQETPFGDYSKRTLRLDVANEFWTHSTGIAFPKRAHPFVEIYQEEVASRAEVADQPPITTDDVLVLLREHQEGSDSKVWSEKTASVALGLAFATSLDQELPREQAQAMMFGSDAPKSTEEIILKQEAQKQARRLVDLAFTQGSVANCVGKDPEMAKRAFSLLFGLVDGHAYAQGEVAKMTKLKVQTIRDIRRRTLTKMRGLAAKTEEFKGLRESYRHAI